MKVDFSNNFDGFLIKEGHISGDTCYLIYPEYAGCNWNEETLIFRSSIWTQAGDPVSLSFPKFFNWHEKPSIHPAPSKLSKVSIMEKLDGSTLIVSKYKGELIIRTRGTFSARTLYNGYEIDLLIEKYPKCFEFQEDTADYTLLFEWTSPDNVIVICPDDVDIKLIGKIYHKDYSLETQDELDKLAVELGVGRPARYKFDSIPQMIDEIKAVWKGKEGVCVYYNNDQCIRKIKSDWYNTLHRLKSELGNYERVVDFFIECGMPNYRDLYDSVCQLLDYEIAEMSKGHMSKVCDAYKVVQNILEGMENFVEKIKHLPSRKEQASKILEAYGNTNRASYVFNILDKKPITTEAIKKLIIQTTK